MPPVGQVFGKDKGTKKASPLNKFKQIYIVPMY